MFLSILVSAAVPQPPVADRFALIIDGLCRAIAAQRITILAAPLVMLLWNRLRRNAARFATLAARVQAGTLASRTRPASRVRAPKSPAAASAAPPAESLRLAPPPGPR